ncbi:unnamed protein product [Symbiodinium sp. CCMP2592]|nr:unnamed protein product [Symbiodinium sp. CCMP2592]
MAIARRSPKDPSPAEIDEHRAAGHVTHRSWCIHCCRARAGAPRHATGEAADHDAGRLPYVSLDYFYLNSGQEKSFKEVCLKSDNENPIVALKKKVKEEMSLKVHLVEVPVEDHQANGYIEVGVREMKRQVRAILSDLQERLGFDIEPAHPCMMWLPRHAAYLLSRFRVGADGRTPYERTFGRKWKTPLVSFGEHVLFRPRQPRDGRKHDLEPRVSMGMFVGVGANNDVFIMTERGVVKGASIMRRPPADQYKYENWSKLRGVPWRLQAREPGELRVDLPVVVGQPRRAPQEEVVPRNLYVLKSDLERHGYTPLCPGCEALICDMPRRSHNNECRLRIQAELQKTEDGKARIDAARARLDAGRRPKNQGGAPAAAAAANAPVLVGAPEPDAEMAAGEAAGEPEPRGAARELQEREDVRDGSPRKKRKEGKKKGEKRDAEEDVEVLHERMQQADGGGEEATVMGPLPSAGSRDPQPERVPEPSADSAGGSGAMALNQFTECLCAVLRDARAKGTVKEVFSVPRVAAQAQVKAMRPGFSVDLEATRGDGEAWDLSKDSHVNELFELLEREEPKFLGGSPPRGPLSSLQQVVDASAKVAPSARREAVERDQKHLRTTVRAYWTQVNAGRYFLHEHPSGARSWEEPEVKELKADPRVFEVRGPTCRWSLSGSSKATVNKETRWLTNSSTVADVLRRASAASKGKLWHREAEIVKGRVKATQEYPAKLVQGILEAFRAQLIEDGEFSQALNMMEAGPVPDSAPVIDEEEEVFNHLPEASDPIEGPVYDSNTGAELDLEKVAAARKEELEWVRKQDLYEKVPEEQAKAAGKMPITMKWVDRNKGDNERPNYRSRLVCREVKRAKNAEFIPEFASFSAMPPLEAVKLLLSLMVTLKVAKKSRSPLKLRLIDISRAHFYGKAQRDVFVTLPEGDRTPGMVGKLRKSMYGTRDAAAIWQADYTAALLAAGFERCPAWPAIFFHKDREIRLLVHGDDFLILSDDAGQAYVEQILRSKYDLRVDGSIGQGEKKQEFCVLNRLVRFDERSGTISYEPDPRHAEIILKDLEMETCKPVKSPNEKLKAEDVAKRLEMPTVAPDRISKYRSLVMRAAFLAQDRPDLSETVKCLARKMQGPTEADFGDLKRVARYLKGTMRLVQRFTPQRFSEVVTVHADSDFAGCLQTRKSTTGLVCYYGKHEVRHSSNLQSTVSLSSGEAEYYALVKGVASGMATQELLRGWGLDVKLQVHTDSAAALGTCNRLGLGKSRHVQTRYLWIQEKLANKQFELFKIDTKLNTADLLTKSLAVESAEQHLKRMGFEVVSGGVIPDTYLPKRHIFARYGALAQCGAANEVEADEERKAGWLEGWKARRLEGWKAGGAGRLDGGAGRLEGWRGWKAGGAEKAGGLKGWEEGWRGEGWRIRRTYAASFCMLLGVAEGAKALADEEAADLDELDRPPGSLQSWAMRAGC